MLLPTAPPSLHPPRLSQESLGPRKAGPINPKKNGGSHLQRAPFKDDSKVHLVLQAAGGGFGAWPPVAADDLRDKEAIGAML